MIQERSTSSSTVLTLSWPMTREHVMATAWSLGMLSSVQLCRRFHSACVPQLADLGVVSVLFCEVTTYSSTTQTLATRRCSGTPTVQVSLYFVYSVCMNTCKQE